MAMIGVQTAGPTELYGIDGAYRVIREAGFDAVDVNLDDLLRYQEILDQKRPNVFNGTAEESYPYFQPYKDAAEKYGIVNAQAHAPFPTWVSDSTERTITTIICCVRWKSPSPAARTSAAKSW